MSSSSSSAKSTSESAKRAREGGNQSDAGDLRLLLVSNEPLSGPVEHALEEEDEQQPRAKKRQKTKHAAEDLEPCHSEEEDSEEEAKSTAARLDRVESMMQSILKKFDALEKSRAVASPVGRVCPRCKAYNADECVCVGKFCPRCGVDATEGRHALACPMNRMEERALPADEKDIAMSRVEPVPPRPSSSSSGSTLSPECKRIVVDRLYADIRLWDTRAHQLSVSASSEDTCTVGYDNETGARTITVNTSKSAVNKIVINDAAMWSLLFGRYMDDQVAVYPQDRVPLRHYHDFIVEQSLGHTWESLICLDYDLRMLMNGHPINLSELDATKFFLASQILVKKGTEDLVNVLKCARCGVVNHHRSNQCVSRSEKATTPAKRAKTKEDEGGERERRPAGICKFFNSVRGCFKETGCSFIHKCTSCGSTEHGAYFHSKSGRSPSQAKHSISGAGANGAGASGAQ